MTILLKLPYKRYKHDYEDRISQLPGPILHNILSLLTTKEATKTRLLSKTWNFVMNSFPILDFNQNYFYGDMQSYDKFEEAPSNFTNYVDKAIDHRRCCSDTSNIQKVNLVVYVEPTRHKSRWEDIERWLNYAVSKNVEHMVFHYWPTGEKGQPYELATSSTLFHANYNSLKTLDLFGCKVVDTLSIDQISLSLKRLKLEKVDIDDQTMQSLLSNCSSSLEELSIRNCNGFDEVNISCTKLKSVELCLNIDRVQKVVIDKAPNLRFLSYEGGDESVLSSFKASNFNKNLIKELSFHGITISDVILQLIVREFSVLEKLELISCCLEDNILLIWSYCRFSKNVDGLIANCTECYKGSAEAKSHILQGFYELVFREEVTL